MLESRKLNYCFGRYFQNPAHLNKHSFMEKVSSMILGSKESDPIQNIFVEIKLAGWLSIYLTQHFAKQSKKCELFFLEKFEICTETTLKL